MRSHIHPATTLNPPQPQILAKKSKGLLLIVLISLCCRCLLPLIFPSYYHPDAICQTLEPAHRLAFGYGSMTWEWIEGIRSWFLPGMLAAIMKTCSFFSDNPAIYLQAIHLFFVLFSLIPIYVTYQLVADYYSDKTALLASLIPAFWYELIYFAPKTLNDTIPVYLFILAIYFIHRLRNTQQTLPAHLIGIGALFGIITTLRFHLLPAILFSCLYCNWNKPKTAWLYLTCGYALTLLPLGLLDGLTWSYPFQSIIKNIDLNILHHIAATRFNTSPFYTYFSLIFTHQLIFILPFGYFIYRAAKKFPLLAGVALITLLSFSLIGHKEYRFIFLTETCFILLAALGLAECYTVTTAHNAGRKKYWLGGMLFFLLFNLVFLTWFAAQKSHKQIFAITLKVGELIRQQNIKQKTPIKQLIYNGFAPGDPGTGLYSYLHANVPIIYWATPITTITNANKLLINSAVIVSKVKLQEKNNPQLTPLFCARTVCVYQFR